MKRFLAANIMRTAIIVVLLSILPALAIVAMTGYARYQDEIVAEDARGERFLRSIVSRQEQLTTVMETFVQTLGRLRDVREADAAAASALFRNLVSASSEYSNIFLLDGSGNLLASAVEPERPINFSGQTFFEDVQAHGSFSVGYAVFSPFRQEPVLYFAAPVVLENSAAPGVICAALSLSVYEKKLAGLALPEDVTVYLVDGTGVLASAFPKTVRTDVGERLDGGIWNVVQKAPGSAGRMTGRRDAASPAYVVAYRKLLLPDASAPYFTVLYIQPERHAHSHARAALHRDLGLFAAVILLSLAAAIGLCHCTVRRPWRALLAAATRVGQGELGARVPEKGVGGEIGMLCREFNSMAGTLEARDRELAAAREHAELSRNAKGEFLANMSHEIRTSMNAILGMAYLVLKTDLTAQQRGYVSKLLAAANALLRVINDILDFSKMEAGKMAIENISFSLRRILGSVRSETAARLAEKKLGFDLQISPGVPDHLVGDPLRLSQALMVLVDDAVSRSERGIISLHCATVEQDAGQVTLQFIVRDAGVGLTPGQLAEMRELFANETEEGPTTLDKIRLRLAIANRLFRMMRGEVDVSSVFGEGVLFTAQARFGYAAGELRQPDRLFEGKRALVIDASEVSRQDLLEVLVLFGFTVECVSDMDAALETLAAAEKNGDSYAIVFLDWRPPVADMTSRITRLRQATHPMPPLVLTTASGRSDLPASLNELEIDALLPKPVNESLVFDTIMNLLSADRTVSSFPPDGGGKEQESLAGLTVLLAEDNAVNQQIAGEILEGEGIRVTFADNGEAAVETLAGTASGTFDLVLMDLQMPVLDGFAATRKLREMERFHPLRMPVIAMTAHSDVAEISACFEAGMNDHTGKPIIIDKFLNTIRRWIPPRPEDAAVMADAAAALREVHGKSDAASRKRLEAVLETLAPVLHEGRMNIVRTTLQDGDAEAAAGMIAALDALAGDVAGRKTYEQP